jgi:hypothetical protein
MGVVCLSFSLDSEITNFEWDSLSSLTGIDVAQLDKDMLQTELRRRSSEIMLDLAGERSGAERTDNEYHQRLRIVTAAVKRPILGGFGVLALLYLLVIGVLEVGTWLGSWSLGQAFNAAWGSPLADSWMALVAVALTIFSSFLIGFWFIDVRLFSSKRKENAEIDQDLPGAKVRKETAEADLIERARLVLTQYLAAIINEQSAPSFVEAMIVVEGDALSDDIKRRRTVAVGLSEAGGATNEIPTEARQAMLRRLETLPGGSIGLSGPRGAGKSTLLTSVCGANPVLKGQMALAVLTAAPVEYDGRDFLLHLFASVCRRIQSTEAVPQQQVDAEAVEDLRAWQRQSQARALRPFAAMLLILSAMMVVLAFPLSLINHGTAVSQYKESRKLAALGSKQWLDAYVKAGGKVMPPAPLAITVTPSPKLDLELHPGALLMLGITSGLIGLAMLIAAQFDFGFAFFRTRFRRIAAATGNIRQPLIDQSRLELQNIRFQRNYTSGWSGSLKVPTGIEMGSSSQLSLAGQPESLPEIVHRFREFLRTVAGSYGRIVIGIDELDKMRTAQQAEEFLNGIKSIFGVENCFFLVSVSEDALAAFDRRGIGVRDAFDSALDDIMHVDYLNLGQSRALLGRRILRLHDPFLQLCHMVSGGLPRDLIRVARTLIETAHKKGESGLTLTDACDGLLGEEIRAKTRATSIAIRNGGDAAVSLLTEIARIPRKGSVTQYKEAVEALRTAAVHVSSQPGFNVRSISLARELAVYMDLLIELRTIVTIMDSAHGWSEINRLGITDKVAEVRQSLEVSMPMAEARLADVRAILKQIELTA